MSPMFALNLSMPTVFGNLFMSLISEKVYKTCSQTNSLERESRPATLCKPLQSSGDGYTEEEERCHSCSVGF
jgi:hypothetical protein